MSEADGAAAPEGRERSRWSYLGCGCGSMVLLSMLVVLGLTLIAWFEARRLEGDFLHPEAQQQKVLETLGVQELPPGYFPLGAVSIPFFFRAAMLTDLAPEARTEASSTDPRGFHRRGFIFARMARPWGKEATIREYFEGDGLAAEGPEGFLSQNQLGFQEREMVGRGKVPIDGGEALYLARRGELSIRSLRGEGEAETFPGLATVMLIDCTGSRKVRLALWFGPETVSREDAGELDLSATPADPVALEAFLSSFHLCAA